MKVRTSIDDNLSALAFAAAKKAREKSYSPYSNFKVGAALITESGKIIAGTNIENASYGATVCAERVAIWQAAAGGLTDFREIVIVTDAASPAFPCALCLQVMAEFFVDETAVSVADLSGVREQFKFKQLLPQKFGPQQLRAAKSQTKKPHGRKLAAKAAKVRK